MQDSLKVLSLKVVLDGLTPDEIKFIYKNMDVNTLLLHLSTIEEELKNYKREIYVVINNCYGGFSINPSVCGFIKQYRNDLTYDIRGSCRDMVRHDPILVIATALLGKHINNKYSNLKAVNVLLSPHEIYDIDEYDGMEHTRVEIKEAIIPFPTIPERPLSLFSDIQKFAQENNIDLDLTKIDKFPTLGPYRILD
jgi:hypothetical protein